MQNHPQIHVWRYLLSLCARNLLFYITNISFTTANEVSKQFVEVPKCLLPRTFPPVLYLVNKAGFKAFCDLLKHHAASRVRTRGILVLLNLCLQYWLV